jgi:hypothetical protein
MVVSKMLHLGNTNISTKFGFRALVSTKSQSASITYEKRKGLTMQECNSPFIVKVAESTTKL